MTVETLLFKIALVVVLGAAAQWIAWRFRFPSILLLLAIGFLAGPAIFGLLDPDADFGDLVFPFVSLAVALILFEGGLNLRLSEIPGVRGVIIALITVGMLITWVLGTWGAQNLLGFDLPLAVLFGSILTVSGPTVVLPLLRHIRPKAPLGEILKWEGILIDPVGALFAVLVFEAMLHGEFHEFSRHLLAGVFKTSLVGGGLGFLGALFAVALLKRHLVPDFMESMFSLALVCLVHVGSNHFHPESGLFAVTVMGIVLANSPAISVHGILEFNESLRVLLISSLFILLAARVTTADLQSLDVVGSIAFLGLMVLVARPLAVAAATVGSRLSWRERLFLGWLAPRGIVAAAVSSLFALRLVSSGYPGAEALAPYTFLVIAGTVILYSLTAKSVARVLGVEQENPNGALILGAHPFGRMVGRALKDLDFPVLLVDTNHRNITSARLEGLPAIRGNLLSERVVRKLKLEGIGHFLALTSNHEANSLACLQFAGMFGRDKVYQLPEPPHHQSIQKTEEEQARHLRGRILFDEKQYFNLLQRWSFIGTEVKVTQLTEEFDYEAFSKQYLELFLPLFVVTDGDKLEVFTSDSEIKPKPGQKIITLINEENVEIRREIAELLSEQEST